MNEPSDFIALLIALIAIITSREIAYLVGPYAAIVVLATTGAAISLSGIEGQITLWKGILHVGVRVMLAVTLTVALSELLQPIIPWAKPRYTLMFLALGIGSLGELSKVRSWIADKVLGWFNRKIGDESK